MDSTVDENIRFARGGSLMEILEEIIQQLRKGDEKEVVDSVKRGLQQGLDWEVILGRGLFAGMETVGRLFKEEDMFVPEVIMSAKAMNAGIKVLEPLMTGKEEMCRKGIVILGTVKGDLHDLGKSLVAMMLRGAGFEVIDIGVDASAERFVEAARSHHAQMVGMSALLTTTMPYMKTVIEALRRTRGTEGVRTMIGGACVTQQYADQIGADAYGENAGAAVEEARALMGARPAL